MMGPKSNPDSAREGARHYCKAVGTNRNGANVYDHFIAGRHEEIAAYCGRDVALVRAIYYRMNFLKELDT